MSAGSRAGFNPINQNLIGVNLAEPRRDLDGRPMPGVDGIEATRRIVARNPAARVLILTTFDLDEYAFSARHALDLRNRVQAVIFAYDVGLVR